MQNYVMYNGDIVSGPAFSNNSLYTPISHGEAAKLQTFHEQHDLKIHQYKNLCQGRVFHILGAGPSLRHYDVTKNPTATTIAVNGATAIVPKVDFWLTCDDFTKPDGRSLNEWIKEYMCQFSTTQRFVRRGIIKSADSPYVVSQIFRHSMEMDNDIGRGLFYGLSSVSAAIDLARHLGAEKIVLFGVDYHDRSHAYSDIIKHDSLDRPGRDWERWDKIVAEFEYVKQVCDKQGIEVTNGNPESKLTVFPTEHMADFYYSQSQASVSAPTIPMPALIPDGLHIGNGEFQYWENGEMILLSLDDVKELKHGKSLISAIEKVLPQIVSMKNSTRGSY